MCLQIYGLHCYRAVPFDLSPQFSGFIYGIAMSVGQVAGIISPIISGYILSSNPVSISIKQLLFVSNEPALSCYVKLLQYPNTSEQVSKHFWHVYFN